MPAPPVFLFRDQAWPERLSLISAYAPLQPLFFPDADPGGFQARSPRVSVNHGNIN
jgi:hypothetical protein